MGNEPLLTQYRHIYEPQSEKREDILQMETKNAQFLPSKRHRFDDLTTFVSLLSATTQHFPATPGASRACVQLYNVGGTNPIKLIKISCLYNSISELKIQRNKGQTALSSSDFPSLLQVFHSVPWFSGTIKTSVSHAYPVPLNSFTQQLTASLLLRVCVFCQFPIHFSFVKF